jgi:protein gp37
MAENTKIEWTNHSASPWYGCSKVHTGCDHCYAESMSKRNPDTLGVWGDDGTRVKSKSFISNLEKWNRLGEKEQRVQSVFPSLCDPFEDRPEMESWRREMFEAVDRLPWVRLLLLTKRPENIRKMWNRKPGWACHRDHTRDVGGCRTCVPATDYRSNVSLYYSASDQESLEAGIGDLLKCRDLVPVLGLSLEPLVGPIDLHHAMCGCDSMTLTEPVVGCLDHVIVGGESGPGARPCVIDWILDILCQCRSAGVPCFVKQLGADPIKTVQQPRERPVTRFKTVPLKDSKGGDWSEWPEYLRVREQPETAGVEQ